MAAPELVLRRLDPQRDADFPDLTKESREDGFWMLVRLADAWTEGRNRFSRRGEVLFGAYLDGKLAGVCGLNVDPYVVGPRQGRVRHLYVGRAFRRHGVGKALVEAVVERARRHFPMLNTRAPETAFAFYESLGFRRVEGEEFLTHRLRLTKPATKA